MRQGAQKCHLTIQELRFVVHLEKSEGQHHIR